MGIVARASLRHFARHPWQLGLAALGIALGVSLAVGIDVGTASVRRAFALSAESVTGKSTHAIVAGPSGVPETVYRDLRLSGELPEGVQLAPLVEGTAVPKSGGGALRIVGIDPFAEAPFRGAGAPATGRYGPGTLSALLTVPGAAVLTSDTAAALAVAVGQRLWIRGGGGRVTALTPVEVVVLPDADQRRAFDRLALVDLATAQEVLNMPGRLSRIDLIVPEDGSGQAAALAWLGTQIPAGSRIVPASGRVGALAQMTRAFDLNLSALSLLALLVGAFLIYNTMSFSVVQRRPVLAILRTLGATRGQLGRNLMLEALVLGTVASAVGVLLGVLLSRGLVRLIARAVSDLYFAVSVTEVTTPLAPLVRGFVLGVAAALVSAWPAARDATGTEPNMALHRSRLELRARARLPRLVVGALVLMAAAGTALALSGRSLGVALGALLALLVGCAGLVPSLVLVAARAGGRFLGAVRGATGRIAARSIGAGLSRTGVATAALALALSVTTGVGVMVGSFRAAVERWLSGTLRADVYVSAPASVGARSDNPLPPRLLASLRGLPGVAAVGTNRIVNVPADGATTLLMALDLPLGRELGVELLQGGQSPAISGPFRRGDGVLVSEPLAFKRGLAAGATMELATDRGLRRFRVLGVYRDYASDAGAIMMSRAAFDRVFDDRLVTGIALYASPGVAPDLLVARARAGLGADDAVVVRSNRALREATLQIFDRTFEVTSVLRLIALIVATFGVASALMALGLERVRELATLRALGATPAQVVEVTILETGLLGGLAGVLAIPLGLLLAAVLVFVINQRSFGWTMPLSPDTPTLLAAPLLGLAAGIAAGIYPAWRAARVVPAQALREE